MTKKLFTLVYIVLLISLFIAFPTQFWLGWGLVFILVAALLAGVDTRTSAMVLLIGALIVLGLGLWVMGQSQQSNSWPTAPGVINSKASFCTVTSSGQVVYTGPCVDYQYVIDGQTFEQRASDTGEFSALGLWWRITDIPYEYGQEVDVFYNPNDPAIARLTPGVAAQDWMMVIIGAALSLLSVITFLSAQASPVPQKEATPDRAERLKPKVETPLTLEAGKNWLPVNCPRCGAAISTVSVEWITPFEAQCPFCGSVLKEESP